MTNTLQEKLQFCLENIIKLGIFACLFIPLIVTPFTLFPFVFGKVVFFQIAVKVLLAVYILLVFLNKDYLPRLRGILIALLIWFGILILSTITSVNPYHSFWSTIERREGLVLFLHLAAFFLILISVFRKKEDWFKLFQVSIFVSLLVSLYSLWQLSTIKLPFIFPAQSLTQPGGSLGNPVYVGSYLLFHIFLILILFFSSQGIRRRMIYGSIFVFQLAVVLFLVNARAASLGILGGLFVFLSFWIIFESRPKIKFTFIIGTILLFVLIGSLFFIATTGSTFQESFFMNRFFNLKKNFAQVGGTGKERLLGWEAAIQGIKERPILGWGLENFAVLYDKHFPPEHPYYFASDHRVGVDRAHSRYFDGASTTGILGLAGFLAIIGTIFYVLWQRWKKKELPSVLIYILFGLFAGYLIEGAFIFDTINSYIPLFAVLGFIHFLFTSSKLSSESNKNIIAAEKQQHRPGYSTVLAACLVLPALIFALYIIDIKPTKAVIIARQALLAQKIDDRLGLLDKTFSMHTFINDEVRLNFVNGLDPKSKEYFEKAFDMAEENMKETVENNPLNIRYYLALGRLYNKKGAVYDSSYLDKAEEILEAALKLSPTRQELYYEIGSTQLFKKDFAKAKEYFRKALDLDPRFPKAWWFLGIAQIADGDLDSAKALLDEAINISNEYPVPAGFSKMPEMAWLSEVNGRIDYAPDSTRYFEGLTELYSENYKFHIFLAGVFAREGELEKAEKAAREAARVNPELEKELPQFLEYLRRLGGSQGN